jgi:(p)ppGpp synthase/HD superfamily hydrolase
MEASMESESYDQMCAVVRQHHAHQSRNGGHVPYAQHCERVADLLRYALDKTGEATAARRESILLAGLGHDLIEDTNIGLEDIVAALDRNARADIGRSALAARFGEPVAALIFEVTNVAGDSHLSEYLDKLKTISDGALLIKLADLAENAMNASYAMHENGTENTRRWESLMRPKYDLLKSRE